MVSGSNDSYHGADGAPAGLIEVLGAANFCWKVHVPEYTGSVESKRPPAMGFVIPTNVEFMGAA